MPRIRVDQTNAMSHEACDVEPTPARTYDEAEATKKMLDRTELCFDLKPKRLAADIAYGTFPGLAGRPQDYAA